MVARLCRLLNNTTVDVVVILGLSWLLAVLLPDSLRLIAFLLANVGIVVGYLFLGSRVVPRAAARLRRTRVGGILFFVTCGLTHLHLIAHATHPDGYTISHMIGPTSVVVHLVQVVAVWMFVSGLYIEYVRWGPWRAGHEKTGAVHPGRLVGPVPTDFKE